MKSELKPRDLILEQELLALVPLSRTTIWRQEQRGKFPRRISISDARIAWRRGEIEAWIASREAARERAPEPRTARQSDTWTDWPPEAA
jgi:prophage regulatory protein